MESHVVSLCSHGLLCKPIAEGWGASTSQRREVEGMGLRVVGILVAGTMIPIRVAAAAIITA